MTEPEEETILIGKWNIPKSLFNDYVKFRTFADAYALGDPEATREGLMLEEERAMRWQMSVQRVMELHRAICKAIGVPYSEEANDEFYVDTQRLFYYQVHGTFCDYTLWGKDALKRNTWKQPYVTFIDGYPHCHKHGAMNKVSKTGMWRCLMCHVGYDEATKRILKDSTEGFRVREQL